MGIFSSLASSLTTMAIRQAYKLLDDYQKGRETSNSQGVISAFKTLSSAGLLYEEKDYRSWSGGKFARFAKYYWEIHGYIVNLEGKRDDLPDVSKYACKYKKVKPNDIRLEFESNINNSYY